MDNIVDILSQEVNFLRKQVKDLKEELYQESLETAEYMTKYYQLLRERNAPIHKKTKD